MASDVLDFYPMEWSKFWLWYFCGGGGICFGSGSGCGGGLMIGCGCDGLVVGATNDEAMGTEAFAGSKFKAVKTLCGAFAQSQASAISWTLDKDPGCPARI